MTRARQALFGAGAVARTLAWWQPLAGTAIAAGVLWLAVRDPYHTVDSVVGGLRTAMLPLALGVAGLFDDHADSLLAPVPFPLAWRRAVRAALMLPVPACAWFALLLFADGRSAMAGAIPQAGLTLEFATLLAVTIAAAVIGARLWPGAGLLAGAATALTAAAIVVLAPQDTPLVPRLTGEANLWTVERLRWAGLFTAALAVTYRGLRDPAAARLPRLAGKGGHRPSRG